jgi:uracil-DNA glycosylase family 4
MVPVTSPVSSPVPEQEAPRDCPLCPRLVAFRHELRAEHPNWWNAPVPHFGDRDAWLAICGLAPGKHGANRTGRPFTGDFAGLLLYETLLKFGLATGDYREDPQDGLRLDGVAIVNSVKCVPPQNKPTPDEIATCTSTYFRPALAALPKARVLVALGQIAHNAAVRAVGGKLSQYRFGHLAEHRLPDERLLIDSYHCSRYNQNTNRLTRAMFEDVFARALEVREAELSSAVHPPPAKPFA